MKQLTFGTAYELQWAGVGEMSVGVQKTDYSKSVDTPTGVLPESRAEPWLKYATATVNATEDARVLRQLHRRAGGKPGRAERGAEPQRRRAGARDRAIRRGHPLGRVRPPQADRRRLQHREAVLRSRCGRLLSRARHASSIAASSSRSRAIRSSNLTVIVGTRWLDATVSGPTVDAGLIGEKPVGTARQYSLATADYRFAGSGFSIDATAEHITSQVANSANTIEVPVARRLPHRRPLSLQAVRQAGDAAPAGQQRFRQVRLAGAEQRRLRLQRAAPVHRVRRSGSVDP